MIAGNATPSDARMTYVGQPGFVFSGFLGPVVGAAIGAERTGAQRPQTPQTT
jgi:hypothetical protein